MKLSLLAALNTERAVRRATLVVTDLATGDSRLVKASALDKDELATPLETMLRNGKSGMIEADGKRLFVSVEAPPVRLMVIGAVHVSQALAPMARLAGFDVTIIDPRSAFATPDRFPDVTVLAQWPDAALATLGLDAHTGVVTLTHDPKIDDLGLIAALASPCFYIGALGSRKTHASRLERLGAQGFDEASLARIKAPVGLDIGAVSPAEIAVSVLAEAIMALRKKPLRNAGPTP